MLNALLTFAKRRPAPLAEFNRHRSPNSLSHARSRCYKYFTNRELQRLKPLLLFQNNNILTF